MFSYSSFWFVTSWASGRWGSIFRLFLLGGHIRAPGPPSPPSPLYVHVNELQTVKLRPDNQVWTEHLSCSLIQKREDQVVKAAQKYVDGRLLMFNGARLKGNRFMRRVLSWFVESCLTASTRRLNIWFHLCLMLVWTRRSCSASH